MISKQQILKQLEELETQEVQTVAQLQQIAGAKRQCIFWIGQIERAEDKAKAEAAAAEINGQAANPGPGPAADGQ